MAAQIQLVVLENSVVNAGGVPVGKVVLRTQNPVDVPDANWFVVRRQNGVDTLVCVASVADFTNLPITPPADNNAQRHWRTNQITYYTDTLADLPEMLETTKRRIQAVIDAFKLLAVNPPNTTITFD